ncbi:hypothetical protein IJI72_01630 [Candidatus Saccharibacteria bacterium]|nr:hypothetical protein [Candidatus Saccharibacteria bacterium]
MAKNRNRSNYANQNGETDVVTKKRQPSTCWRVIHAILITFAVLVTGVVLSLAGSQLRTVVNLTQERRDIQLVVSSSDSPLSLMRVRTFEEKMREDPDLMREVVALANRSLGFAEVYDADAFCQDAVPTAYIEATNAWLEEKFLAVATLTTVDTKGVEVMRYQLITKEAIQDFQFWNIANENPTPTPIPTEPEPNPMEPEKPEPEEFADPELELWALPTPDPESSTLGTM